jgi:hypothetical protein
MIAPLGSYGLRGVLWYQGESNTDDADQYRALLTGLMRDWRRQFSSALPFLIVQLPNFGAPNLAPAESGWATLREAQRRAVIGDEQRCVGGYDRYWRSAKPSSPRQAAGRCASRSRGASCRLR